MNASRLGRTIDLSVAGLRQPAGRPATIAAAAAAAASTITTPATGPVRPTTTVAIEQQRQAAAAAEAAATIVAGGREEPGIFRRSRPLLHALSRSEDDSGKWAAVLPPDTGSILCVSCMRSFVLVLSGRVQSMIVRMNSWTEEGTDRQTANRTPSVNVSDHVCDCLFHGCSQRQVAALVVATLVWWSECDWEPNWEMRTSFLSIEAYTYMYRY